MELDADAVDAIRELINIGVGRAAGMLNEITQCPITLKVPSISIESMEKLTRILDENVPPLSTISLHFKGTMSGVAALVFPQESAALLVTLMTQEDKDAQDLDVMRIETLKEVGNIIINAVMGSIANVLDQHLNYSLPRYQEIRISALAQSLKESADNRVVLANAHFHLEGTTISGNILLILEIGSMDALLEGIERMTSRD
ncbi:chemotaxis protein CheC [Methanoregula sp.]|uniref:chemotaxis protein CheC n=1 Tax=Methanoregula sp. TaxID=2052170 RepID=UPI003568FBA6